MGSWLAAHRSPLVLLVSVLVGLVLVGLVSSSAAFSGALAIRTSSLLTGPEHGLPARIEIGTPAPSATVPSAAAAIPSAPATAPPRAPVEVVSPPVYTYAGDDHGGSGSGSGDRPHG